MKTIGEFNADLTARAERYRAHALNVRSAAERVPTPQRLDMLETAQALDELANIIEGLRIGN